MSDLVLLEEEKVIFEAEVLRYYSVLASKTLTILTNKRIIFIPQNKWEQKLFAKSTTLPRESVVEVKNEGINQIFSILSSEGKVEISGSSVPLLIEQLKTTDSSHTTPVQLYRAEVSITRGFGLSTAGQVMVQDGNILLHTYPGIKALFLPSRSYEIFIPEVTEHKFQQVGNKLSITTPHQKLSFLGFGAFVCNIILNLHKNNEDLIGTIHHTSLIKDNIKISGALFVCSTNIYFVPQKQFHRSFDKPYLRIAVNKLQFIDILSKGDDKNIVIASKEKKWTLSIQNPEFNYSIIAQDISKTLASHTTKTKVREKFLFRSRIQYKQEHRLFFGHIFLTHEDLCFAPEKSSAMAIRIPLSDIKQKQKTVQQINIITEKNTFSFFHHDRNIILQTIDALESMTTPTHLLSPKDGYSVSDISGNAWSAILTYNNKELSASFLKVQVQREHIRLLLSQCPEELTYTKGKHLSVDLAKDQSRFYFRSRILSFSRDSNTPIIKAIITIKRPSNIVRHNRRQSLRVPIVQKSKLTNIYENNHSILSEFSSHTFPQACSITNISESGCQLTVPCTISKEQITRGVELECTLTMDNTAHALRGICIYCTKNPRKPKEFVCGIRFSKLDETFKKQLFTYIQQCEQLTKQEENQDEHSSLDSFNPMLRSAMKLTKNPAFSNLDLSEAAQFLSSGKQHTFQKDQTLIQEGDSGNSFFVITSGSVHIRKGEQIIATVEQGSAIGELSLIDPAPRNATVQAKTNGSWIEITKSDFERSIENGDQISIKVLQSLSETVLERLFSIHHAIREELDLGEKASIDRILECKEEDSDE